jgi:hypothetical protein
VVSGEETNMCECITELQGQLKDHNTRLSVTYSLGAQSRSYPTIQVEQIETGRGKPKAMAVIPSHCPFCGEEYAK